MFAAAWKIARPALFPVVVVQPDGRNYTARGTGFFVATDGTFVTCAHVLDPAVPLPYQYIGRPGEAAQYPLLPITILYRDVDADVAIGRVDGLDVPGVLTLATDEVAAGSSVAICGYPPFEDPGGTMVSFVASFQATFVVDHVVGGTPDRRERVILMRDNPFFGMSGGPIIDANGIAVGLQSRVTQPHFNRSAGREFKVERGLGVEVDVIRAALTTAACNDQVRRTPGVA